ncbi:MAG: hypothetical protein FJ029_14920, partial [Actinobacteria bacterium]|nr:hypothetical protein [Actinomycetota bacterium]
MAVRTVTHAQLELAAAKAPAVRPAPSVSARVVGQRPLLKDVLDRHGIAYREQPPDANCVTWYHVERCPFHEDGRSFECGVGQRLPDGPYAGHCFHPEGEGKGWHDFKAALGLRVQASEARATNMPSTNGGPVKGPSSSISFISSSDTVHRPEAPPWPEPLAEAAFHGPVGDAVRAIAPHTEADPAALLVQMLVAVGNVMGRHAYVQVEADLHFPNLFV